MCSLSTAGVLVPESGGAGCDAAGYGDGRATRRVHCETTFSCSGADLGSGGGGVERTSDFFSENKPCALCALFSKLKFESDTIFRAPGSGPSQDLVGPPTASMLVLL